MKHLLVVDDDTLLRKTVCSLLEDQGYRVTEAMDGKQALKALSSEPADLVITDIVMPDVEGTELIRQLRRTDPAVKIIAVSGSPHARVGGYLDVAKKLGASRTLSKPFELSELLSVVRELLSAS